MASLRRDIHGQLPLPPLPPLNQFITELHKRHNAAPYAVLGRVAGQLLGSLTNPRNVTILTTELLLSPALWEREGVRESIVLVSQRLFTAFYTAARLRRETDRWPISTPHGDRFAMAVIQGIRSQQDVLSQRVGFSSPHPCKDLMVLAGLVKGFTITTSPTSTLLALNSHTQEQELWPLIVSHIASAVQPPHTDVIATFARRNGSTMGYIPPSDPWAPILMQAVVLSFEQLPHRMKSQIPPSQMIRRSLAALLGTDGLEELAVLQAVDYGIQLVNGVYSWPAQSREFAQFKSFQGRLFVSQAAPLANIINYLAAQRIPLTDPRDILVDLVAFSDAVLRHWTLNKFSLMDLGSDPLPLDGETTQITWPALQATLRSTFYSIVAILRAVLEPLTRNFGQMGTVFFAECGAQVLKVLRNLSFVSAAHGLAHFEAYSYVEALALDMVARIPVVSQNFLREITPHGSVTTRTSAVLTLFYLKAAAALEPTMISSQQRNEFILEHTMPFLRTMDFGPRALDRELFLAANDAVVSVLRRYGTTVDVADCRRLALDYTSTILNAFPRFMSARQFRASFEVIIEALETNRGFGSSDSTFTDGVMEMARERVAVAGESILPRIDEHLSNENEQDVSCSEKGGIVWAMIDALCHLHPSTLEFWLPSVAADLNSIRDPLMRQHLAIEFQMVTRREQLPPPQLTVFMTWWHRGGSHAVLSGHAGFAEPEPVMSGALPDGLNGARSHI